MMREMGEKNYRALGFLTKELGFLIVVNSGAEPGELSDQDYASSSTGDREDIQDPVESKFLNDDLPTILENMRTSGTNETQFLVPSSKGSGLSVYLKKGEPKDLQDNERALIEDAIRKEIVCLLEELESAKTLRDNEAEKACNINIPHLFNQFSTIPLDLIGMVYKIEPEGSYLRRTTLQIFLAKEDPRGAFLKVQGSGIPDFESDFYKQISGFGKEGDVERYMDLLAHPLCNTKSLE